MSDILHEQTDFDPDAEEREFLNDDSDELDESEVEECVECNLPLEDCTCDEVLTGTESDD